MGAISKLGLAKIRTFIVILSIQSLLSIDGFELRTYWGGFLVKGFRPPFYLLSDQLEHLFVEVGFDFGIGA